MLAPAEAGASGVAAQSFSSGVAIRLFDVVISALLLIVVLPLMALVMLAVLLESPGPVFFRCERVGYGGRRLQMLKVRKMRHGAQGPALTAGEDARFTRIGGLLATLKIDEIPQLFHVLRGQMSLVGPRPESAEFVGLHPEHYAQILSVRPGITGLSQVAFVDERRILDLADPLAFYTGRILPQKLTLDLMYVNRRSLSFNLRILFWTVAAVLLRRQVAVHRETGRMGIRRR